MLAARMLLRDGGTCMMPAIARRNLLPKAIIPAPQRFPWLTALAELFYTVPDVPDEPQVHLKDPWPGNAQRAEAIIANEAELIAALDPTPRDPELARDAVRRARAQSFGWLRDLRSLGGDASRRTARRVTSAWIETNRRSDPIGWRVDVVGERLAAWLGAYDFFAASAGVEFRTELMEQAAVQSAWLRRRLDSAPPGPGRFAALAGLAAAAAALGQGDAVFQQIEGALKRAIRDEIGSDGVIAGATPLEQLDALMRLLDLRAATAAVGREPSPASADAAQAISAPLAAWRLGDGGLATFGGGEGDPWTVDLALAASGWRGRAPLDLAEAGYARSLAGRAILMADRYGALEFSHGTDRLFTSIGAQSDAPPSRFAAPGVSAYSAPSNGLAKLVDAEPILREQGDGASLLTFQWRTQKPDARWRRRVFLSADGKDMRGEDTAIASPKSPAMLAFHLHTGSDAIQLDDGGILIRARSGQGWRFRSDIRARLAAEPYRGRPGQPAASARIELPMTVSSAGAETVRWSLRMEPQRG
jgi:uncharacterized heparinase superfamily protein